MNIQRAVARLNKDLVSYGSCQIPTLGFIVDRYFEIKNFVPENFWYIYVTDKVDSEKIVFHWKRVRLFNERCCFAIYLKMMNNMMAKVISVQSKPTTKYRPTPMDTICLEKLASSKLKISAKKTMAAAEKLYSKGLISYPRTETNKFEKDINLETLVQTQTGDSRWGNFARGVLNDGPSPRQGKKSDQAHPPIHPLKLPNDSDRLTADELKIYELIARHFLACVSADAIGKQMTVKIKIDEEEFETTGLKIIHRNFLEVYPYIKWSEKELPDYVEGTSFMPYEILQNEGTTTAPALLSESDLISLMEKHGIGTDATHAEHIETIQTRSYAKLNENRRFEPLRLGLGLVNGYINMGLELSKPRLRAALERDLEAVCNGERNSADVLREQINSYRNVFVRTQDAINVLLLDVKKAQALTDDQIKI